MTVRVWNVRDGVVVRVFLGHTEEVISAVFSIDGIHVVSASKDNTVRIWSLLAKECVKVLTGHTDFVSSASFSKDGSKVVSASADMSIRIWNIKTGACIRVLEGHSSMVLGAQFNFGSGSVHNIHQHILEKVNQIKAEGNLLFNVGKYNQAIMVYLESLSQFKDDISNDARSLRSKIFLNISLCYDIKRE
mmetsp:Transcript_37488/g.31614  ORF Transcript_37488/g.31614 Transcript_37488/m.31614 type:complete len:190 (+) Transcript_37488:282-851(+)